MENKLQQAKEFRENKNYKAAAELYSQLYDDDSVVFNNWDIWSYVHCLKKEGQLDKSITLSEKHIQDYPDFVQLKNNLVWAYFDKYIKHFNPDNINEIESTLERVLEINGQQLVDESNKIPCPFSIGVFKVLAHYKRPNFNSFKIRYWIDKIDASILSKAEQTMEQDGQQRELASDYEKYYGYLIPLLFNEQKYMECIEAVEHALKTIPKLHYSNQKWFKRKMALSHFELGELDKAEEILKSLDKGNSDKWFIDHELSVVYFEQGNYEKSLELALKAAKGFGEDLMKVNLYTHLARIFYKQEKLDYSKAHAELVIAIKQANGSKLDIKQQKLIAYFKINKENEINLKKQKRIVEDIWNELVFKGQRLLKGTISKILPNGKTGFIQEDYGESYYFSFGSVKANKRSISEGKRVSFYLIEGFDKKKNKKTMNAIEIKIIN